METTIAVVLEGGLTIYDGVLCRVSAREPQPVRYRDLRDSVRFKQITKAPYPCGILTSGHKNADISRFVYG